MSRGTGPWIRTRTTSAPDLRVDQLPDGLVAVHRLELTEHLPIEPQRVAEAVVVLADADRVPARRRLELLHGLDAAPAAGRRAAARSRWSRGGSAASAVRIEVAQPSPKSWFSTTSHAGRGRPPRGRGRPRHRCTTTTGCARRGAGDRQGRRRARWRRRGRAPAWAGRAAARRLRPGRRPRRSRSRPARKDVAAPRVAEPVVGAVDDRVDGVGPDRDGHAADRVDRLERAGERARARGMPRAPRAGSGLTISARIDSAISGAVRAPMSTPTCGCTRAPLVLGEVELGEHRLATGVAGDQADEADAGVERRPDRPQARRRRGSRSPPRRRRPAGHPRCPVDDEAERGRQRGDRLGGRRGRRRGAAPATGSSGSR